MKPIFLLLPLVFLLGVSCERHEFHGPDGTARLHQEHNAAQLHEEAADHEDHAGRE